MLWTALKDAPTAASTVASGWTGAAPAVSVSASQLAA